MWKWWPSLLPAAVWSSLCVSSLFSTKPGLKPWCATWPLCAVSGSLPTLSSRGICESIILFWISSLCFKLFTVLVGTHFFLARFVIQGWIGLNFMIIHVFDDLLDLRMNDRGSLKCISFKDIQTGSDGHHMDTAPGVGGSLCRCAWHWLNRFPDVFCILPSVTQMLFWGHAVMSSILLNNLLVSRRGKRVCLHVCVFLESPLGRGRAVIACSNPGAGYGHPGHVSCVGAKPNCGFLCF